MASIYIPNSPQNLTMQDFRSVLDAHDGLAKSARFITRILPTGSFIAGKRGGTNVVRDLMYLCEIVDMPGRGFEVNADINYYGPNFKLPFLSVYDDLNMTFLCRHSSAEREFFDDWMTIINPVNTYDFNYRDEYKADIDIFQLAEHGNEFVISKDPEAPAEVEPTAPIAHYNITVHDAFPIQVHAQPMTWGDDTFLRLMVTFAYQKWSRKGLDPVARTTGPRGQSFTLVEGRNTGGF